MKNWYNEKYNPNPRMLSECHENEFIRIIFLPAQAGINSQLGAFG